MAMASKRQQLIHHRQGYRTVQILEDYVCICNGDHRKAAILGVIEQKILETFGENADDNSFVCLTLYDFLDTLTELYSEGTIHAVLAEMVKDELIERHREKGWSRSYLYRINTSLVNTLLDGLPDKIKRGPKAAVRRTFNVAPHIISPQAIRLQQTVLERFNGLCAYCQEATAETWDHIIPQVKGGKTIMENLVPACYSCNASKNDRDVLEWLQFKGIHMYPALQEAIEQSRKVAGDE